VVLLLSGKVALVTGASKSIGRGAQRKAVMGR
jgi:NAD(P)-dependent dehydrogenase (short-subunit alcohol dehydrogenase family)